MTDPINDMLLDQIIDMLDNEPPQDAGQHPSLDLHARVGAEWADWHERLSGARIMLGHRLVTDAIDERKARAKGGCGSCLACDPLDSRVGRMYLCATCGNERCPAATDCHKWECSGSNDPKQNPIAKHSILTALVQPTTDEEAGQ